MSQVLFIVRGIPGSGKSDFAIKWVRENPSQRARVNRDDLRMSLFGYTVLEPSLENIVSRVELALIKTLLESKKSVIVDNQNLKAKYVKPYLELASLCNVPVIHKDFPIELDEALRRNRNRERFVDEDVITRNFMRFTPSGKFPAFPELDNKEEDVYIPDTEKPTGYIFDLDGTLALLNRGPFEWEKVADDSPNDNVILISQLLKEAGHMIVITSGRSDICREDTELWLNFYNVPYDVLLMRQEGDMRRDSIVKKEIFNDNIRFNYNILGVFDDRLSVAKLWHSLGLTLFRVGNPEANF